MTSTSEQSVQKQSASAEERANSLWEPYRAKLPNYPFTAFYPTWLYELCLEAEALRLTNQRLEAEVEGMKKGFDCDFRDLLWWYSNTGENPIGTSIGEILPQFFKARLHDPESQKERAT